MLFVVLVVALFAATHAKNECTSCKLTDFSILRNPFDSGFVIDNYDVRGFNKSVFNDLQDVNEVIKKENDIEMTVHRDGLFSAMSHVLLKHGLNDIVGVSILHNHFSLNDTEILVLNASESVSDDIRFIAFPTSKQHTQQNVVPYMFKYESAGNDRLNIYPLQYIHDVTDEMQTKYDMLFSHKDALLDIGRVLLQFDMMDRIGIFIDYLDGSGGAILSESTDLKKREQRFKVVKDENKNSPALITHYTFKEASCIEAYVGCEVTCYAETICRVYCEADSDNIHRQGHDSRDTHGQYHD